jgi:hypothetical protein
MGGYLTQWGPSIQQQAGTGGKLLLNQQQQQQQRTHTARTPHQVRLSGSMNVRQRFSWQSHSSTNLCTCAC